MASTPSTSTKKIIYTALAFAALGLILWGLGPVLWPFLLGALVAYVLHPGVEWLARHKVPRALSVLLMMLFLLCATVGVIFLEYTVIQKEAPRIQQQVSQLLSNSHKTLSPLLAQAGLVG